MVGFVGVPCLEQKSTPLGPTLKPPHGSRYRTRPAKCRAGSGTTLVNGWPVVSEVDTSCNTPRRSIAQVLHLLITIARLLRKAVIEYLLQARRDGFLAQLGHGSWRIVKHRVSHSMVVLPRKATCPLASRKARRQWKKCPLVVDTITRACSGAA